MNKKANAITETYDAVRKVYTTYSFAGASRQKCFIENILGQLEKFSEDEGFPIAENQEQSV